MHNNVDDALLKIKGKQFSKSNHVYIGRSISMEASFKKNFVLSLSIFLIIKYNQTQSEKKTL